MILVEGAANPARFPSTYGDEDRVAALDGRVSRGPLPDAGPAPSDLARREAVRRGMRSAFHALAACYEQEPSPCLQASTRRWLEIAIEPSGRVAEVHLAEQTPLGECIASAIRAIAFELPEGTGALRVRYPLSFICDGP